MIVQHFLKWIDTAKVAERAAAADALARAYAFSPLNFEDRCAAEAALTMLLDDPSPKVRMALAESLSLCHHAPVQIVSALASDQPEVAAPMLMRSSQIDDAELIERVIGGTPATQKMIAMRPLVSAQVCAAIAELGDAEACVELLHNCGSDIAAISLKRMAERHGMRPDVREAMLADRQLAPDTHHLLMTRLAEQLCDAPLVRALIGKPRAEKITREACIKASVTLIDQTPSAECPALVEHLRLAGELTSSFLVRVVAHGKIDFFGAALVKLSGQQEARVRPLLANGRDIALEALFRSSGLAAATHRVLVTAIHIWRDVAKGKRVAGPQEVSWLMLRCLEEPNGHRDPKLSALLSSIHVDLLRENARMHAIEIQAA